MTGDLLKLVNKKNDKYRDWKSTSHNVEYARKKGNFKPYDRIVNQNIRDAKNLYYFKGVLHSELYCFYINSFS